jgi:hypothetical protein
VPRRPYTREHSRGALPLHEDRATPEDIAARLAERDARDALDNRTPAQVWLGDPPAWRSALAGWPFVISARRKSDRQANARLDSSTPPATENRNAALLFDVVENGRVTKDDGGDTLANDAEARTYVRECLAEQARSFLRSQQEGKVAITIRDNTGPRFRATLSLSFEQLPS